MKSQCKVCYLLLRCHWNIVTYHVTGYVDKVQTRCPHWGDEQNDRESSPSGNHLYPAEQMIKNFIHFYSFINNLICLRSLNAPPPPPLQNWKELHTQWTMNCPLSSGNHYAKFGNYQANGLKHIERTMMKWQPVACTWPCDPKSNTDNHLSKVSKCVASLVTIKPVSYTHLTLPTICSV